MRDPNQDDAALYLRLHALKDTAVQAEARAWFFEQFGAASLDELNERYPRGSRERHLFAEFLGFYEGAGVLVSRGLLHEDVYFDAPFALELVWPKVGRIIDEMRETVDPAAWENVAWLAERYDAWRKTRWRAKLEAVPPERGPA
ncbi:MAG TPA: hypothetical protein VEF89_06540 [Solirubrobacteraceae bacterium]|nr:hypothetical protein [Solirubrobacteraceae bacterium]